MILIINTILSSLFWTTYYVNIWDQDKLFSSLACLSMGQTSCTPNIFGFPHIV